MAEEAKTEGRESVEMKCRQKGTTMSKKGEETETSSAELYATAENVASSILHYIDTMYPLMWNGVPKSARVSVRNIISNKVRSVLSEKQR